MHIKRREFLQAGSLATASFLVPGFLKAFETPRLVPPGNKVVVILQLSGGNDGLNTVIPVRNDIYYRNRPGIGIEKGKALLLDDETGLHPALQGLHDLYNDGSMAVLNSVGYPNPDRSHFRSMDIWHTASHSHEYLSTGWMGRYLDAQCNGCDKPTYALELDDVLSLAMKGEQSNAIAMKNPARLFGSSNHDFFRKISQYHRHDHEHEAPADYLYKTLAQTVSSAEYIFEQSKTRLSLGQYPDTELGRHFKVLSSLILSDINTRVYYLSLGSFDTHINQSGQQQRLFTQMNDAIASFVQDLKKHNRFQDVLLMSFSEFGRRVKQNASGGTDHGTANNMFFISGGLKQAGMLNELPDLANLDTGDLQYKVDFKNVYATLLAKWLQADDRLILGSQYDQLDFI